MFEPDKFYTTAGLIDCVMKVDRIVTTDATDVVMKVIWYNRQLGGYPLAAETVRIPLLKVDKWKVIDFLPNEE